MIEDIVILLWVNELSVRFPCQFVPGALITMMTVMQSSRL